MRYDVRWHAAGTPGTDAFARHAADHFGVPADAVTSGRLCPRCGSSEHGRPWLRVGDVAHHVSLSRTADHVVTVIADVPVGVDVESAGDVARGWDGSLVLAPGEAAGTDDERARAWARKEAVLKQRGTGLSVPMTAVVLAEEQWCDLPAPSGCVAALSWAGRAAPST